MFELAAYMVGFQLLLYLRKRRGDPAGDLPTRLTVLAAAGVGGALGSKVLYWLEDPAVFRLDPFFLMQGKSIVGALLMGVVAVELAKKVLGVTQSTGDLFVDPLIGGMVVGRLGCFFSGVEDGTHGQPVAWGMDLGDGVPRHPTALYEAGFLLLLLALPRQVPESGDRFKLFMTAYLLWRLGVEFLKTQPIHEIGLSSIQLACLLGLAYYFPHALRIIRARRKPP